MSISQKPENGIWIDPLFYSFDEVISNNNTKIPIEKKNLNKVTIPKEKKLPRGVWIDPLYYSFEDEKEDKHSNSK